MLSTQMVGSFPVLITMEFLETLTAYIMSKSNGERRFHFPAANSHVGEKMEFTG